MPFHELLTKLRTSLAKHGLLAPGRLDVLRTGDLDTLVTMALPGEDLSEDEGKDLILWLEVQAKESKVSQSLQLEADSGN